MTTGTVFFVLREGSTREEQWSWEEIEALHLSGELTPRARIYLPDEGRWVFLSETRLGGDRVGGEAAGPHGPDSENAALEEAYRDALERAGPDDDEALEALLDAGALAAQLGRRDEAREHLQRVLDRHPYHPRAAQEIRRRFPVTEQRTFRLLERAAPVWEDLGAAAAMPLARGPLHFFAPAVVFAGLSFLPFGGAMIALLAFLWMFQTMEYTARGAMRTPDWNHALADPWARIGRPLLLVSAAAAEWAVPLSVAAWLSMLSGNGRGGPLWGYMAESPVFVVLAWIIGVLWLPAATVSIGGFAGSVAETLDPRRLLRMVVRMEHEYVYTVALLGVLVAAVAVLRALTGSIPLVANVAAGLAWAYAVPLAGLMLGRLLGRTGHIVP